MLAWQRVLDQFLGKCYSEVGMQVNYCSSDLHELRKKQVEANQKTGNVTKNALSRCLGCVYSAFDSVVSSGLKVSLSFHRKKQSS